MKKEWETRSLGEIADVEYGFTDKSTDEGYYRYIRITDIDDNGELISTDKKYIKHTKEAEVYLVNGSDLLMARTGATFAKVLLCNVSEPSVFASYLIRIKFKIILENKLYWYFSKTKSYWDQANSLMTGAAQPQFNGAAVKKIIFTYPKSISEQQRIIAILDKAFAAIDKAKANTERNLQNVRELFESYLDGMFENKSEEWEERKLGDVCEFRNGAAHEQHISENGKYILVNSKFISVDGEKIKRTNIALSPLFVNDIVFVMSDVPNGKALAKCFLVDKNNTYTLNQRIGAVKSKVFYPKFLLYQLNRNKYLLSFNNGENQTNLRKDDILNCPLSIPTIEIQKGIVSKLDAWRVYTKKLETLYQQKIDRLGEMKKTILQKAFSGDL